MTEKQLLREDYIVVYKELQLKEVVQVTDSVPGKDGFYLPELVAPVQHLRAWLKSSFIIFMFILFFFFLSFLFHIF